MILSFSNVILLYLFWLSIQNKFYFLERLWVNSKLDYRKKKKQQMQHVLSYFSFFRCMYKDMLLVQDQFRKKKRGEKNKLTSHYRKRSQSGEGAMIKSTFTLMK